MQIAGYHGTSQDAATSIRTAGFDDTKISPSNCWFGRGHYFFEDFKPIFEGKTEAIGWAKRVRGVDLPCVVKAVIESQNYVDLLHNLEHKSKYGQIRDRLLDKHRDARKPEELFTEFTVFEAMKKIDGPDFIRVPCDGGRASKKYKANYVERFQVQVVVYQQTCISSITIDWTGV